MNDHRKGFTVIELLAVLAIIFTLVGIGIPAYNSWKNRSKIEKARADIQKLEMAAEMYRTDYGQYPSTPNALITQDARYGKFTSDSLIDPWNKAYEYNVYDERVMIRSYGPNGNRGDGDDITNEEL